MFVNKIRLLVVTFLTGALAVLGTAAPRAFAASSGAGPVIDVSSACAGQNAEVEQAVAPPHYVYEAWIGCGGEGFARSVDGGAHFSKPITLPDSSHSDDPAVAVARDGTVYVSYLRYFHNHAYPVVATSFDHGASFSRASSLIPHVVGNWGDRDFIAAGRGGTVYVTWDYGPSAADVKVVCSPTGSCAYSAVDATAVVQKSTDHGKTWGPITPMQPGFPAGGGYDASILVQPNGVVDALMLDHPLNRRTFAVHPGPELFTSSSDGGKTWSAPIRVTADQDNAVHNVESAGAGPGIADIAWQADNSPRGYATYLRPFSIRHGWLAPAVRVSSKYGDPAIWPGDTFGVSVLPGRNGAGVPKHVALSWGSAVGGSQNSEIYATVVGR